jgi:hypothetical protein
LNGDRSLKLHGQFSGIENISGVGQGITISAGEQVQATLSALVRSSDSIAGTNNVAQMKIEFYSEYGGTHGSATFLGETDKIIADGASHNDVWSEHSLTGIAPAGATEARVVLEFLQPNNQSGAVHIDNVLFEVSDVVSYTGDYNHDGIVDQMDYLVWREHFGATANLNADGNGNGIADAADYVIWRNRFTMFGSGDGITASCPNQVGYPLRLGHCSL